MFGGDPFFISCPLLYELRERFRDEEIEEEDNREEMAQSDIEIAGDGEDGIEQDKSTHSPFGHFRMETFENTFETVGCFFSPEWEPRDAIEAVEYGEEEEKEKWDGFLHEEDCGEIIGRSFG